MKKLIITTALLTALTACVADNAKPTQTAQAVQTTKSPLSQLDLSVIGTATAIGAIDDKLLIINEKGEIWQDNKKLTNKVSQIVSPVGAFGRVAFADDKGNFSQLENGKLYQSNFKLSPHSGILVLPHATLAVIDDNGTPRLARIESKTADGKDGLTVTAKSDFVVLPDARPLRVALNGADGVAILATPDSTTYPHAVLGDEWEAGELALVERHSLKPLTKSLKINNMVFEANRLDSLTKNNKTYLITTIAGAGNGASVVAIDNVNDELKIVAQSQALPSNRWQSPFVVGNDLYSIQMPHLAGKLVKFDWQGDKLTANELGDKYSNHTAKTHETNLTVNLNGRTVVPSVGYQKLSILANDTLTALNDELPSPIVKGVAVADKAYYLLKNGQVWVVQP